jgi:conjugative transfer pilus assembly protein TraH
MTLLGTIIYVPPKDDEPGKFVPIVGEASSTLVTSLLDGTANGNVLVFDCDEPDKVPQPGLQVAEPASIESAAAARGGAHRRDGSGHPHDTAISEAEGTAAGRVDPALQDPNRPGGLWPRHADRRPETLAEIASVDLLFAVLDRIVSEAGRSMSSFIGPTKPRSRCGRIGSMSCVRRSLTGRPTRISRSMPLQIIEKTAFIENMLAASMSPGMAASLDWSRGLNRALTH